MDKYSDIRVFFIKDFPLSDLTYKPKPGMQLKEFAKLVVSIRKNGMQNPIIVEREPTKRRRYVVKVGHNRCCALRQLGHTTADIIVSCKEQLEGEEIDLSRGLDAVMPKYYPMGSSWVHGQQLRVLRKPSYNSIL